jgi:hypothetical protein
MNPYYRWPIKNNQILFCWCYCKALLAWAYLPTQSNVTLVDLNTSSKIYWTSHFIIATQHAKHHYNPIVRLKSDHGVFKSTWREEFLNCIQRASNIPRVKRGGIFFLVLKSERDFTPTYMHEE